MRSKFQWVLLVSLAVLSARADDKKAADLLTNEAPSGKNIIAYTSNLPKHVRTDNFKYKNIGSREMAYVLSVA